MYFRSGEQIFQELQGAIAWFESIGISTQETRIQAIGHYLFDQITGLNPGTTVPEPDHSAIISDASGFALIAKEFSRIPSNLLPRRTLSESLRGQLCPSNEDTQSSDARNKFFELELAAHLSVTGVKLVGFDDVQMEFEGYRYVIECKRPFLDDTFEGNLGKAYSQLGKRLKGPMDRGIAAIAIEKVLTLDDKVHQLDSSVEANDFAKAHCETLKQRIVAYGTTPDVRIVGVLFVSRFLMHLQERSMNAVNYLIGTLPFHYGDLDPLPEESRLLRFTAHLSGNFGAMA
jgi:hypothetical protein